MGGQTEWTGQSFSGHRLQDCIEGSIKGTESFDSLVRARSWTGTKGLMDHELIQLLRTRGDVVADCLFSSRHANKRNEGEVAIEKPQKDSNTGSDIQFSTKPTEKKRKRARRLGEEFDRIMTKLLKIMSDLVFTLGDPMNTSSLLPIERLPLG
ncbi:hypothetical protein ZIOFF_029630 [Zingiber officinale]|uniref:Uncharacterized protein n=1 Tax=Zingiber officinale TaxID=94328 RepID=A0A8J5LG76_ZINOF|nr:hypothetical protein ZIOFF_029630 [Zingiber officinale]